MAYWLLKTEPDSYSIDDLAREKIGTWDGVRNYTARNNLKAMAPGDLAFFYHSSCSPPGVVGICRVVAEAHPDASQFDPNSKYFDPKASPDKPRWYCPDVTLVRKFDRLIPLGELRETPGLEEMELVRRSRLSVQKVTDQEWKIINNLVESP